MTPLERAAQPIAKALAAQYMLGFEATDSEDGWERYMDEARELARAVLTALREPTEGMLNPEPEGVFAGFFQDADGMEDNDYITSYQAGYVWKTMIDAALKEG